MPEADDIQMLREFAERRSEAAFTALATRHVNLVYSVALRQTGNPHAAEEITQAVFIILARKAESLGPKTILSGWLYQATRLTAANHRRTEFRRARREQEAYMQSVLNEPKSAGGDAWLQIAPLLDDALGRLGERDRHAIVLRFFENKSLEEVGAALGASEDAAKMRVNRALEKLRKIFSKRGVVLTATLIAGAVSANSVQAAPVGLAMTISAMAVKGSVVAASITTLVQGTMKIMTWMKLKLAACVGIGLIVVVGASTIILAQIKNQNTSPVGSAAANETIVIVPMESVGKVRRGMTTNEVEAVLGKPERMQGKMMIYDKKFGMSVGQTKLGVMVVFCGDSSGGGPGVKTFKGRTKEGIGTGSSREEVVKALGQPTSAKPWEARLQQEQLQYKPLGLEFMLEKGKVFNILVDFRKPQ